MNNTVINTLPAYVGQEANETDNVTATAVCTTHTKCEGLPTGYTQQDFFGDLYEQIPTPESPSPKSPSAVRMSELDRRNVPFLEAVDVDEAFAKESERTEESEFFADGTCQDAADLLEEPETPADPLIANMIDNGEVLAVVAQAKDGKSFYVLLMAVCIALGIPFLGRKTTRKRVYVANLEITKQQYVDRLRKICEYLNVKPEQLRGWLYIHNLKGIPTDWDRCRVGAKLLKCSVAIIDCFYQIFKGEENNSRDCINATEGMKKYYRDGLTLIVVFHSQKGFKNTQQLTDMIAGSSVLAQFPESIIALLKHAQHSKCKVIKGVFRNYAPIEGEVIEFKDGVYERRDDLAPEILGEHTHRKPIQPSPRNPETQKRGDTQKEKIRKIVKEVCRENKSHFPSITMLKEKVKDRLSTAGISIGGNNLGKLLETFLEDKTLVSAEDRKGPRGATPIGLPEQMSWYHS